MELAEHLRTIWRNKWRVAGISFVIALLVYFRSTTLDEVYGADALLGVTAADTSGFGAQEQTVFLAQTYAAKGETDPVLELAIAGAGLDIDAEEAGNRVGYAATDVGFLTVRSLGPSPGEAARLAQAAAVALVDAVTNEESERLQDRVGVLESQLESVTQELRATALDDPLRALLDTQLAVLTEQLTNLQTEPHNEIRILQDATEPTGALSPTPRRDAILALLVALVLNAELFVLIETLSDRFSKENVTEEIQSSTGLTVLAEIPRGDGPEVIEAFRLLRTNLMFLNSRAQVRTLAVVGVEPGSGKSHVSIGLATSTSDLELPVVLVDADLRRPVIHHRLDLPIRPGLGDLRSKDDLDRVARPVPGHPFLRVIAAGSKVDDPSGLLGGGFRQVLTLIGSADLIVVDTPAAGLFAEATAIAAQCDATIVVLDANTTRKRSIIKLVDNLRRVSANPVGIVLNRVDPGPRTAYSYYDRPEPKAKTSR